MSGDTSLGATVWPNYALPRGTTVNGYRIERVLGSGGFGVTYLARDLLQQPFAIKEYYPRQFAVRQDLNVLAASADDAPLFEECRERFLREAQALVLLGRVAGAGEGIVRVQTYFEAHGTCFLVMDYVEGASLASVLQRESGGLIAARVRVLLTQLLSSIKIVHQAGLMHRDIKPANIILRDDDRVVLIDFGSSREATSGQTTAYTQIYSGGYAPPEQMLGLRQGAFSDIYAIGAVGYRAIGGAVVDALARQIALTAGRPDPQAPAAQIGAGRYPGSLLAAIDAALTIDAAQRPQDVDAMLAALGRDEPVADATVVAVRRPVPTGMPQQPRPQPAMQRRRGVWGAAAGVGALVVAGAAYVVLRSPATSPRVGQPEVAASTAAPVSLSLPPTAPPQAQRQNAVPSAADATAAQAIDTSVPSGATPGLAPSTVASAESLKGEAMVAPAPTPTPGPTPSPPNASPAVALAPVAPEEPPRRAAIVPAAPAPTPPRTPSPPDVAPTVAPASGTPAELPQRQAIVIPPAAPAPTPAPAPQVPPSPLETARTAAQSLPCSVLHVASGQGGLRVSGLAPAGQELDRLLAELHDLGRLADDITRVDRFICTPIATVSPLVRQTWAATPTALAIRLEQREVASGARLGIDVVTTLPAIYIDLYQSDGSVRHLLRPAQSGRAGKPRAEWPATPPPGPRLVVAIGSAIPLDLGARPDIEKAADYLTVLQQRLRGDAVPPSADLAMVTVRAAEPAVAKVPQPRPANLRSDRCANIVSRAQLGETLSDAEIAALRTECRS
jgi:predicted Ser/Thr protein kinase